MNFHARNSLSFFLFLLLSSSGLTRIFSRDFIAFMCKKDDLGGYGHPGPPICTYAYAYGPLSPQFVRLYLWTPASPNLYTYAYGSFRTGLFIFNCIFLSSIPSR